MSEQELTGKALAQAWYDKIAEAAKQLTNGEYKKLEKCTGLIIIAFKGEEATVVERVGNISMDLAIMHLVKIAREDQLKDLTRGV